MSPSKRGIVFYPLLFALYFFLLFYSTNSTSLLFPVRAMLQFLGITLVAMSVIWLGLTRLWQDAAKSGLYVAVLILLFFSYGHVYEVLYLRGSSIAIYVDSPTVLFRSHAMLLFVWGLLLAAATMLTIARGHLAYKLTSTLNFVAGVLIAFSLIAFVTDNGLTNVAAGYLEEDNAHSADALALESAARGYGAALPDIYYIILDEYARADILRDYFDYDNTFIDVLEARNFSVVPGSESNYPNTIYSLSSSLNMRYLDDPGDSTDIVFQRMIQDSTLCRTMQELGYRFIMMESIITGVSQCADMRIANVVNILDTFFLKTTLVRPLLDQSLWGQPTFDNHLSRVDALVEIPKIEDPTFMFAHFILPHGPFVFDSEGNQIFTNPPVGTAQFNRAYLDQLTYTNVLFEDALDRILAESEVPPIIIIQADHGAAWIRPSDEYYDVRLAILNAYHLPFGGEAALYPSISPVNSFRVILNYYFDAGLELLDDQSFTMLPEEGRFEEVARP